MLGTVRLSIPTTAVTVLPLCPTNSSDVHTVCDSSLGPQASLCRFPPWTYSPMVFGRNTCSWKCCGKSLGFHMTSGLPTNCRNKWTLLDRKASRHFVKAKYYQYHINLCQNGKPYATVPIFKSTVKKKWCCRATEAERTIKHCFNKITDDQQNIKLKLVQYTAKGGET